jgi:indolepyruvate ferredoxin oxidoreductase
MIERHIATLKGEQIPVLARKDRLPEMIRGYGHIKEQNIGKSLAEKARLEADSRRQPLRGRSEMVPE